MRGDLSSECFQKAVQPYSASEYISANYQTSTQSYPAALNSYLMSFRPNSSDSTCLHVISGVKAQLQLPGAPERLVFLFSWGKTWPAFENICLGSGRGEKYKSNFLTCFGSGGGTGAHWAQINCTSSTRKKVSYARTNPFLISFRRTLLSRWGVLPAIHVET